MKPICIIPARAGSETLPNKNVLYFKHKPLIHHTIEAAIASGLFDDIIVSSDSKEYLDMCRELGVVCQLRPGYLATSHTPTFDVVDYILADYPDDQTFVLLQPTSPFRTGRHIIEAYDKFNKNTFDHLVSCVKADKPKVLYSQLEGDRLVNTHMQGLGYKRQDYDEYTPNGAIYISTKNVYIRDAGFFSDNTGAYIMDKKSSHDIDDAEDFKMMLGLWYFSYENRKSLKLLKGYAGESVLLGDSRHIPLNLPGVTNLSVGGLGLYSAWHSKDEVDFADCKTVHLALGLNDCIVGFSFEEIIDLYHKWFDFLKGRNVTVYSIGYGLFRSEVDNDLITRVNAEVERIARDYGYTFVDTNDKLSKDGKMLYDYCADGMHYNEEGTRVLQGYFRQTTL